MRITWNHSSLSGTVRLPASKSISNRLLVLQFLNGNNLCLNNLSGSDDTILLSSTLDLIRQYLIKADKGLLRLDARNAGTVMRFLAPVLALTPGYFLLTGSSRMKQRPIGPLVEALRDLGADIEYADRNGFPPLLIKGRHLSSKSVTIDASVSSQFVSGLMLVAPTLPDGLVIEFVKKPVSWPYVQMTGEILRQLGVRVVMEQQSIRISPKTAVAANIEIEPDWSAAAFWYSMLALADGGELKFPGLTLSGLQGDQQASVIFHDLGVETLKKADGVRIKRKERNKDFVRVDFNDFPDLALPVIIACAASGVNGLFTGLDRLRIKESDRLAVMNNELLKTGVTLYEEAPGEFTLSGKLIQPCDLVIDEAEDHRVAMAFTCLAMKGFAISFNHPEVVAKSYPKFWDDLESAGFMITSFC